MCRLLSLRNKLSPLGVAALCLLAAAPSSAQPSANDPRVQMPQQLVRAKELARVAVVAARNLKEKSTHAIATIRGQLTGMPVSMVVEWVDKLEVTLPGQVRVAREVAKRTGAKMVLWADLSLPDQIFVYIAKGDAGRILVRSVRSEGSNDSRLEAMSLIVRSSVAALAAGAKIGFLPPPASQPVKAKVQTPACPPRPPKRRELLTGEVSYGVFGFGSEVSHGAQLGLTGRVLPWLRLGLSFRALQTMRADGPSALVVFERYPLGLEAIARWRRGRLGVEGGVGIWVERLQWTVTPKRVEVLASGETSRWVIAGQAFGGLSWRLIPSAALTLRLGVDLPHDTRPFEVQGPTREQVADPWPVQPWVLGGLRFALF
ncbi:MAG: hypothetical protein JRH20_23595 [Deltaproteobacteria bacterium]|nr:hypothetical protein [Deltaproteobacteria bacterium]